MLDSATGDNENTAESENRDSSSHLYGLFPSHLIFMQ